MISISNRFGTNASLVLLSRLSGVLVASIWVLALWCGGAFADEDAEAQDKAVALEAVTVTANKMEEDTMDVPQNVMVIDEMDIEERGINDVEDIIDFVPSMSFNSGGQMGIAVNFRGLNISKFSHNNPVALYVDGVGYSGCEGFDASLANVERVEVLHGPQSTLYGKDSMGAVINIITKAPTNTWAGKAGAEYGSWQYRKGLVSLNGPLAEDNLFLGFSSKYEGKQGWIKNDYPGMNDNANRDWLSRSNGYLLWTPESVEDLRVRLSIRHDENKQYWGDQYNMGVGAALSDFDAEDAEHVSYDVDTWSKTTDNVQSLHVEYAFSGCKLDSISSHMTQQIDVLGDSDFGDNPNWLGLITYGDTEKENWAQEFRLSSLQTKGFRWLAGAYVDHHKRKAGPFGQEVYSAYDEFNAPNPSIFDYDAHSNLSISTKALFGQVVFPLWDSFELTLGGRAQRIDNHVDLITYTTNLTNSNQYTYKMDASRTDNAILPKAALAYNINENWTTYLSYTHGYMAGGFNTFAMRGTEEDNSYDPEKSINYEWGIKAAYNSFRMSAALFYMDISDIHVSKREVNMFVTDNAKKAHSRGIEIQAAYKPTETIELQGAFSAVEARYDDYDVGTKNLEGERIENTPTYSVVLGAAYHAPCGFYARVDGMRYGQRSYYNNTNQTFSTADPYTVVDGKVGWLFEDFDAYAYVKNAFDEGYLTSFYVNNTGAIACVGEPRKIGVGVMYRF